MKSETKIPGKRLTFFQASLRRLITAIPLLVTWFFLSFLFHLLSDLGRPLVNAIKRPALKISPDLADFIAQEQFLPTMSVIMIVVLLYFLGLLASMVVGRRVIGAFDALMHHIPVVQTV